VTQSNASPASPAASDRPASPPEAAAAITPERLLAFTEEEVEVLARRLEEDDYATPFDGLQDWHLLRALAIHRPELVTAWVHLVDQEPFDED
jgi:hypothetical protein